MCQCVEHSLVKRWRKRVPSSVRSDRFHLKMKFLEHIRLLHDQMKEKVNTSQSPSYFTFFVTGANPIVA